MPCVVRGPMFAQLRAAVTTARLPSAASCSTIPMVRVNESPHFSPLSGAELQRERPPRGRIEISGRLCKQD